MVEAAEEALATQRQDMRLALAHQGRAMTGKPDLLGRGLAAVAELGQLAQA
jgi:hypothetical protein